MSTLQDPQLRNRLSPVYMLPDDVLAVIFEETFKLKDTFNFYQRTSFEIVVSHVTRRWRDVSINLSSLWCNIDIVPFQSIDLLQIYLARSQKRLLHINFKLGASMPPTIEEDESLAPCLVVLIDHVERWRLFTVGSYSYPTIEEIVIAIRRLSAPNLVHFAIYLRENECQQDLSSHEHAFSEYIFVGGAPCLSYFECVGVGIQSCWPPLGALTELRLNCQEFYDGADPPALPLDGEQFQQLLMSIPSLTTLRIKGPVVELEVELPQIKFPHLISLDIDFDYDIYFLSVISAPAITTLALGAIPSDDELHVFTTVEGSTWQKYSVLTHLEFNYINDVEFNPNFAKVLPAITHLSFRCCDDTLSVLTTLAECGADEGFVYWPKLETILINPVKSEWIQPLCEFVAARISSGNALENIMLSEMDIERLNRNEFLNDNVRLDLM